jgi:hypothetical protein
MAGPGVLAQVGILVHFAGHIAVAAVIHAGFHDAGSEKVVA